MLFEDAQNTWSLFRLVFLYIIIISSTEHFQFKFEKVTYDDDMEVKRLEITKIY